MSSAQDERSSWAFEAGAAIASGRTAVRKLGGGERFEAWLGWDDRLASPVVFKLLRPARAESARARAAIAREAEILRSLDHPRIVRCFGADVDGARPYLVLEYLDGPRLSTLIRRYGPLAVEQLAPLAVEVGSAMAYLHHEGWLHLDVKPQNVIMGAPPRVIDLSIARRAKDVADLRGSLGTAAYMAPEQGDTTRLSSIGPWSDVWGLGATLYEAVNGHRPFRKRRDRDDLPQRTEEAQPFRPGVPAGIRETIVACLAREPEARPSVLEVMAAFDELLPSSREIALKKLRRRIR